MLLELIDEGLNELLLGFHAFVKVKIDLGTFILTYKNSSELYALCLTKKKSL